MTEGINMELSKEFLELIGSVINSDEFKKTNYYLRCLKKAPHGGVFHIKHPNIFIKYYRCQTEYYLRKGYNVPYPVEQFIPRIMNAFSSSGINQEELLKFCFAVDLDNKSDPVFGERFGGYKCLFAMSSGTLTPINPESHAEAIIGEAVYGNIPFSGNFIVDEERLAKVFYCFLVMLNIKPFETIQDILSVEELVSGHDKYGLTDVTNAVFSRQGFLLKDTFYLYSLFLDTSISSLRFEKPAIIDVFQSIQSKNLRIFMRLDKTLAVPKNCMITTATIDMQKWRGITFDFSDLKAIFKEKHVTIHFAPDTLHKLLIVITPNTDSTGRDFLNITVEQLWNPERICKDDSIIITNFVHGCYYSDVNSFDHIDFSVNQYKRDDYILKYADAYNDSGVSIEKYADEHYKVWCIKGNTIDFEAWAKLVYYTLDEPFRDLFLEMTCIKTIENK